MVSLVDDDKLILDGTFYKHRDDTKKYFHYGLENECNVYFIIDERIRSSSVSFDMMVGHNSNNHNGMAHLLEHMLFMGSSKYPDPYYSQEYISQHGGYTNAYTTNKNTNYYFKVESEYLLNVFDIFCNLFIDPIFDESTIKSEIDIVQSEHDKNINSDSWRIRELSRLFFKNEIKFGTGTKEIFDKIDGIKDKLKLFFQENYSSNLLNIYVYHNNIDCIDQILNIASQIKNNNLKEKVNKYILTNNKKLIKTKLLSEQNLLQLYLLKDNLDGLDIVDKFVYHLSLILKKLDLILDYNISTNNDGNYLIVINFTLTRYGFQNYMSIINIIRSYFYDLKDINEYIDESNKLKKISLENYDDSDFSLESIVRSSKSYDMKYMFVEEYMKTTFKDYNKFRNQIINEKFSVLLGSNILDGTITDIFYPTRYDLFLIKPMKLMKVVLDMPKINQFIDIKRNEYVPDEKTFTKIGNFYCRRGNENGIILINKVYSLGNLLEEYDEFDDRDFLLSKFCDYIFSKNELFIYDLHMIGIELNIRIKKDLFIITLIGNMINNEIISKVLDVIYDFDLDEEIYSKIDMELKNKIDNYWFRSPYEIIESDMKNHLFKKHHVGYGQLIKAFKRNRPSRLGVKSFSRIVKDTLSFGELIGFMNGNFDFFKIMSEFTLKSKHKDHKKIYHELEFFQDTCPIINRNKYEKNIGVSFGMRLNKGNNKKFILLNHIIKSILNEKVSNYIRERLGYVVIVKVIDMNRSYGIDNYLVIIFQTNKKWKKVIEEYMRIMINDILDKERFDNIRNSMIKLYQKKITNKNTELRLLCNYIIDFDIKSSEIDFLNGGISIENEYYIKILKKLNYSDLIDYVKNFDNKFMIELKK